jgi:hypothetical protein
MGKIHAGMSISLFTSFLFCKFLRKCPFPARRVPEQLHSPVPIPVLRYLRERNLENGREFFSHTPVPVLPDDPDHQCTWPDPLRELGSRNVRAEQEQMPDKKPAGKKGFVR